MIYSHYIMVSNNKYANSLVKSALKNSNDNRGQNCTGLQKEGQTRDDSKHRVYL